MGKIEIRSTNKQNEFGRDLRYEIECSVMESLHARYADDFDSKIEKIVTAAKSGSSSISFKLKNEFLARDYACLFKYCGFYVEYTSHDENLTVSWRGKEDW